MATRTLKSHMLLAQKQWDRYMSAKERGHDKYQQQAKTNENYYLGNGRQWDQDVKDYLTSIGKPWLEENMIFSTVNTVVGYQTQSRMDIAYKPREEGDQEISDIITKLSMFVVDQNKYPWVESEVFTDGLIQQRGFFDIRMKFDDNFYGDISITNLDPLDVIPDPDAKSYDPDDWSDVMVTRWETLDDLKVLYGPAKYRQLLQSFQDDEADFGDDGDGEPRNKFGDTSTYTSYYKNEVGEEHLRVIERQWYKLTNRECWYNVETGEVHFVPDGMKDSEKKRVAKENNYELINKVTKRIRWTVSTKDVILHDDWSPYDHFTIVPYFPYFRRGVTTGLVDNLIKTQEMINKTYSQMLHVINSTANSGWIIEEDSLVNMEVEELESEGAKTGLVIEYKRGRTPPEKIQPNQIPAGLKDMAMNGIELLQMISGVTEVFKGGKGPEVSGTAIQSRVHQSAIQLAAAIDNLFRTRHMVAIRLLELLQKFYTEKRTFLVINDDEQNPSPEAITINQEDDHGNIINDITMGKYDVVVADVPTQITFQNAQFSQALEMRKFGVMIPDDEMVRMSTLSRKNEISKRMSGEANEEQQRQMKEQYELQIEQLEAVIKDLKSKSDKQTMESQKAAAEIANMIAQNPALAPIMDSLLDTLEQPENPPVAPPMASDEALMPQGLGSF